MHSDHFTRSSGQPALRPLRGFQAPLLACALLLTAPGWAQAGPHTAARPEVQATGAGPRPSIPAPSQAGAATPATAPGQPTSGDAPANGATPSAATADQPAAPTSLLVQPPSPAIVTEQAGQLSVKADNSSLADILRQVASKTGMQLSGLSGDERVFGVFGPGDPHEVLNNLLNGSSYNVLMVGSLQNGAPRELLLTHKSGGPVVTPAPATGSAETPADDSGDDEQPEEEMRPGDFIEREQEMQREQEMRMQEMQRIQQQQQESQNGGQQSPGPRTPDQMLRQMQQQQQQQPQQ